MKHYLVLATMLIIAPISWAEKMEPIHSKSEREHTIQLKENFEKSIVPMSRSLAHLLTRAMPTKRDEKHLPINMSIALKNSATTDVPIQAIVFHCAFDQATCEPFFRACASLYLECTGGNGPTP